MRPSLRSSVQSSVVFLTARFFLLQSPFSTLPSAYLRTTLLTPYFTYLRSVWIGLMRSCRSLVYFSFSPPFPPAFLFTFPRSSFYRASFRLSLKRACWLGKFAPSSFLHSLLSTFLQLFPLAASTHSSLPIPVFYIKVLPSVDPP